MKEDIPKISGDEELPSGKVSPELERT